MAWYPHARKRELPYAKNMPTRRQAKTVALHTNGGGTDQGSLYHWFARSGNNVASHFQVMTNGTVEQYISTSQQAYAQVAGNDHCVSIETEDGGHRSRPWTNAQIDSILGICRWLDVPAKVGSQTGDGIVWHSLFPAYNPHGHDCPGSVRVAQIKNTLIPELAGDDDMAMTPAERSALIKDIATAVNVEVNGTRNFKQSDGSLDFRDNIWRFLWNFGHGINAAAAEMKASLARIEKKLGA